MAIYVDPLTPCVPNHRWRWDQVSHLLTDNYEDLEELHRFAYRLGLRREWFQDHAVPHYDLTPNKRHLATRVGATEADRATLREILREWRKIRTTRLSDITPPHSQTL